MTSPAPYHRRVGWPKVHKGAQAVLDVIRASHDTTRLGLDLEFHSNNPTIIGVAVTLPSGEDKVAAANWTRELGEACVRAANAGVKLVAYSGIAADKPVLEAALGVKTPLASWTDSLIQHWIMNPDLASVSKATGGEEAQDQTFAMMNIWAATSLLHDIPHWKGFYSGDTSMCTDPETCLREQHPCPVHCEQDYCGVDSWAGLVDDEALRSLMAKERIPESYYEFQAELAEYCLAMQEKGVPVDQEAGKALDAAIKSKKATLFPCTFSWDPKPRVVKEPKPPKPPRLRKDGTPCKVKPPKPPAPPKPQKPLKHPKKIWAGPFNPNSPKAVTEWFEAQGVSLRDQGGNPSMGKQVILKALQRRLKRYGLKFDTLTCELEDSAEARDESVQLSVVDDYLLKLVQKTFAGKGTDPWLHDKYILNRRIHARPNPFGTSMGRLSYSKPNLQNVSNKGWGAELRKVFVAEPGCQVVKADFNSLEAEIGLWFGRSQRTGEGLFEYLVQGGEGKFEAACLATGIANPRDLAKTVVYANLYLAGTVLLDRRGLSKPNRERERRNGALLVYDGQDLPLWTFRGEYVCNTGGDLSERLFGNRTDANRKKALELQALLFQLLPELRNFQREAVEQAERENCVRLPSGHRLPLYGRVPEDDMKQAVACKGQGGGAIYSREGMLRFKRLGWNTVTQTIDSDRVISIQVHDEFVFMTVPLDWNEDQIAEFMSPMVQRSEILIRPGEQGFTCPAKVSSGPNWKEQTKFGVLRSSGWERL